jgi:hypothetical protein
MPTAYVDRLAGLARGVTAVSWPSHEFTPLRNYAQISKTTVFATLSGAADGGGSPQATQHAPPAIKGLRFGVMTPLLIGCQSEPALDDCVDKVQFLDLEHARLLAVDMGDLAFHQTTDTVFGV